MSKNQVLEKKNSLKGTQGKNQLSSQKEKNKNEKKNENPSVTDNGEKIDDTAQIKKSSNSSYKYKKLNQKIEKVVAKSRNNLNSYMDKQQTTTKAKVTNKKVTFSETNFLILINVESYKKYNAENTCDDPFENNKNNDKNQKNNDDVAVTCSCFIF